MSVDCLLFGEEEFRVVLLPPIHSAAIGVYVGGRQRKLTDLVRIADEGRGFALLFSILPLLCRVFITTGLLVPQEDVLCLFWTGRGLFGVSIALKLALLRWVHRLRLSFSVLIIIFELIIIFYFLASITFLN